MRENQYANLTCPDPQPSQITITPSAGTRLKPREKYKTTLYMLGITEIFLGVASCLLWLGSIVVAVTTPPYCFIDGSDKRVYCFKEANVETHVSAGVWCGVFLIVSGCLGVQAKKKPSMCMYTANMAVSIVTSVMMSVLLIISLVAAVLAKHSLKLQAFHALLSLIAIAGMVTCVVHAAYCCAGTCCHKKHSYGRVVYTASPALLPHQYLQYPDGQTVLIPSQPMLGYSMMAPNATPPSYVENQISGAVISTTTIPDTVAGHARATPTSLQVMSQTGLPNMASIVHSDHTPQQQTTFSNAPPSYDSHTAQQSQ